ncbi:MAG: hypothetical protein HQL32_11595 [Planctomycetes bacterium]|nr:hypothetical protein [Planctomycetota bacterium]
MSSQEKIVYCHCAYANIINEETKRELLAGLAEKGISFEMIPDLCEAAAKKDPSLKKSLANGPVCLFACYDRAVKWLSHMAELPNPGQNLRVLNMRENSADILLAQLEKGEK